MGRPRVSATLPARRGRAALTLVGVVAVWLALGGLAGASVSAEAGSPCLTPAAETYVNRLFRWEGDPAALQVGPLGNIRISAAEVRVSLLEVPGCTLLLLHPDSATQGGVFGVGRSFRVEVEGASPECPPRAEVAARLIVARDTGPSPWPFCRRSQSLPKHEADVLSLRPIELRVSDYRRLWILLAMAVGVMVLLCLLLMLLGSRLDRRARVPGEGAGDPRAWESPLGRMVRWCPFVLTGVFFLLNGDLGLNEEMVAGFEFHAKHLDRSEGASHEAGLAPCEDGLYRQEIRPRLGMCVDGSRWPLLLNQYTTTVSMWPITALVRSWPALGGDRARYWVLPFTMLMLWLLTRMLIAAGGTPTLVLASLSLFLFFPQATIYASLYLYEYLSLIPVLGVFLLLGRWNRRQEPWCFFLASCLAGLAVAQKVTYVLVVLGLVASFLAVYGLRRVPTRWLLLSAGTASLPVLSVLFLNALDDPALRLATPPGAAGGSLWESLQFFGHSTFSVIRGADAPWARVIYLLLSLAIVVEVILLVSRWLRRDAVEDRFPAFVALMVLVLVVSMTAIYSLNRSSTPVLQYLPFVVILMALGGREVSRWALGHWPRRGIAVGMVVLLVVVAGAVGRWREVENHQADHRIFYSRSAQQSVADQLVSFGERRPFLVDSFFNGVFELLSRGRLQPVYLRAGRGELLREDWWKARLERERRRREVYLFCLDSILGGGLPQTEILAVFRRAVKGAGRRIERERVLGRSGERAAFVLVEVPGG